MFCRKCGKEISNDSKHCDYCGEVFVQKKSNMSKSLIIIHVVVGILVIALFAFFILTILSNDRQKAQEQEMQTMPTEIPEIEQREEIKQLHPLQNNLVGMWDYVDEFEYWVFIFEEDGSYTHYRRGQSTKQILETYRGRYEVESDKTILIDDIPRLFEIEGDAFRIADPYEDYLWGYLKTDYLTLYDGEKLQEYTVGKWKCVTKGYEDLIFEFLKQPTRNPDTDEEINYIVYKKDEIIDDGYYGVGHDGILYFDNKPQEYVMRGWQFVIVYEGESLTLEDAWEY